MSVQVTEEGISKANAQFWEQMLGIQLESLGELHGRCIGEEHVLGSCDLAGVWSGRIEVRLTTGLARAATSAMLMQPAEGIGTEDLLDATREIANMIAGTIKSALPRPCTMTVPNAEIHRSDFCDIERNRSALCVFFQHASGELMIRVTEAEQAEQAENSPPAGQAHEPVRMPDAHQAFSALRPIEANPEAACS